MIDICLLGTGGMMPLPGRALTSLYVRSAGRSLLIDCGEGTQTAIRAASLRFKPIEAILITHFHADHTSGLPGLLLTLGSEGRTEPLTMYGPEGLEQIVTGLRSIAPELPFQIVFHEFPQDSCVAFDCAGLKITAFPLDHGIPCFGYHMSLERKGRFDPQRAKELGVPTRLWSILQRGECAEGFAPEDVLGPARHGLTVLYATDTRPVPSIAQFGSSADLLILEGIFGSPDKQSRAEVTHHMMMQEAALLARSAKAKELWLTHFSPATSHPEEFADQLRELFPHTVIGTDGMKATLRFK